MTNQNLIVVVDPFSSSKDLVPLLDRPGISLVAIVSSDKLAKFYTDSLDPSRFEKVFFFPGDQAEFLAMANLNTVLEVFAGSEPGVTLANEIAASLRCQSHKFELAPARRNKFEMQEAIKKAGLKSIKQCTFSRAGDIQNQGFDFPLVVKPLESAGTDGVRVIKTLNELDQYLKVNLGTTDLMGNRNENFLAQELIEGVEYVVDMISMGGEHYPVAVWKYTKLKVGGSVLYDQMALVALKDAPSQLIEYTQRCLDAIGIVHGPTHSELFLTESGPVLCETGARLHGGKGPSLQKKACGFNQVDLAAELLLGHATETSLSRFKATTASFAIEIFGRNRKSGVITREYEPLYPTISEYIKIYGLGALCQETTDLITSPSRLLIVTADKTLLNDEVQNFRDWEMDVGYV